MKKNQIILVDLDNVVADQRLGFYAVLEKYPHITLPALEALKEFDIELNFLEEHRQLIRSIRLRKKFFRSLPIIAGAKEGLTRLLDAGRDVRLVTTPTWEWKHCVAEKYAWVEEHLGRDWCGRLILTRDKTLVRGDILIDDAPEVAGTLNPSWEHVLFDQPHNQYVKKERVTWSTIEYFLNGWTRKN